MREVTEINKKWKYFSGEASKGKEPRKPAFGWKTTDIPLHTEPGFTGKVRYGKTVYAAYKKSDLLYLSLFGEAGVHYTLAVNEQPAGEHDGTGKSFRFELTPFLKDEKIVLFLTADYAAAVHGGDESRDTFFDEAFCSARLIKVPKTHFDLSSDGECGLTATVGKVNDTTAELTLTAVLENPVSGRKLLFEANGVRAEVQQTEPSAVLTVPKTEGQSAYTAKASLLEGGEATDSITIEYTLS